MGPHHYWITRPTMYLRTMPRSSQRGVDIVARVLHGGDGEVMFWPANSFSSMAWLEE